MSTDKTKKELQEELNALKIELDKHLEEKRYLAEAVEAKDKRIAEMESGNDITLDKAEKKATEAEEKFNNLLNDYNKLKEFCDRRTSELEEVLNLFVSYEQLITINLDFVKKIRENLVKKIQE